MEGDSRRLQPASIGMASIETGEERYTVDGHMNTPPFSPWRNSLTALSQRFNLYFVASRENIAVFVPQFPYQKLGRTPSLVICPTLANKSAHGYIDRNCPHAINHLIVGDLGNEEIVLVARDSGNVDAYHTRAVRDAIGREPHRFSTDARSDNVGLRAFFSHWVHESAWGLAIHKEARMIAVSANVPHHVECKDPSAKVTVFTFALTKSTSEGLEDGEAEAGTDGDKLDWPIWEPSPRHSRASVPSRDRNYKIVLGHGHTKNIPSVSFANTSDDQDGTWMFSTDIDGDMIAWNIWQNEVVNMWTTTVNESSEPALAMRWTGHEDSVLVRGVARRIDGQTDSGWLVAALDPRAFAVASSMTDFCGLPPQCDLEPQQDTFSATDIAGSFVPGNSQRHPQYRHLVAESDEDDGEPSRDGEDDTSDDNALSVDEDEDMSIDRNEQHLFLASSAEQTSTGQTSSPAEELGSPEEGDASTSNDHDGAINDFSPRSRSPSSVSSLYITHASRGDWPLGRLIASAEEGEQDLRAYGGGTMAKALKRYLPVDSDHSIGKYPDITLLHCSVSHVRLFQAPLAERAHWYCADLLTQLVPTPFVRTAQYAMERLNMFQQIPELGLVILASQSGRCAVCSMTRKSRKGPLGLRVDWVLPTTNQEKAGLRPPHALLGIAAGPIQGMMKGESYEKLVNPEHFRDGAEDETLTSFDANVLVMDSSSNQSRNGRDEHETKRLKILDEASTSSESHPKIEQRPWSTPPSVESWRGINYSRRYRLMLTYYDSTVLTYEISREVPHLGIDSSRRNHRNRSMASDGYHNAECSE